MLFSLGSYRYRRRRTGNRKTRIPRTRIAETETLRAHTAVMNVEMRRNGAVADDVRGSSEPTI
jgi:hypothetical protein